MEDSGVINIEIQDIDHIFEKPERLVCTGTSNSGKTHLIECLVRKYSHKFYRIILCGNKNNLLEFKETREKTSLFSSDNDIIYNPFLDIGEYEVKKFPNQQFLIIIDDLMDTVYKSSVVCDIFSKGRHINVSCILILQAYCPNGTGTNIYPLIKNNSSIQIFTKCRAMNELNLIASRVEFDKKSQQFFKNLYKKVVLEKKYGYLTVMLDASDCKLRYCNNLVDEDGTPYLTIFTQSK